MRWQHFTLVRGLGSLAVACGLTLMIGCGDGGKTAAKPDHHDAHGHGEHAHPEEGPHEGHLIELGKEEYHAELLHDDATHKITLYLLDGSATKIVPIVERDVTVNVVVGDKPAQFKIPAVPQADDPAGTSSRFELVNEQLCEALDDPKSKARLNLTIAGKPFSGDMAHEEHGHDHKK
jgi:hypothetical protein